MPMDDDTSSSLLLQLRMPGKDVAAWDRFVRLYTPFLAHCLKPLSLQPADAADLLQDVFLLLYQKLPEFNYDRKQSFRAWLKTVLLNKWRDWQKGRSLRNCERLADLADVDSLAVFEEEEYRRYLVKRALEVMQADFQPTTWQACWQIVVQGRPAAEVAAELGLSLNAVYAANYRVLHRLRQDLDGLLE